MNATTETPAAPLRPPISALCSACGQDCRLTKGGGIRHHRQGEIGPNGWRTFEGTVCPGTGKPPAPDAPQAPEAAELPTELRIALVGCGAATATNRREARWLYTGNLFSAVVGDVLNRGVERFVVSAKHGLVHPERELDPYDYTLKPDEAANWADDVAYGLLAAVIRPRDLSTAGHGGSTWSAPVDGLVIELHMGETYAAPLREQLPKRFPGVVIEEPARGLMIGRRLALYARRRGETLEADRFEAHADNVDELAEVTATSRCGDPTVPPTSPPTLAPEREPTPAHPYADLFPLLDREALNRLADDIRGNGLREPVTLLDGLVLDGRNRERACILADVLVVYEQFAGADPLAWVISRNLDGRRHLTDGQRALIGAQLPGIREAARHRQEMSRAVAGVAVGNRPATPAAPARKASEDAAAIVGVSARTIDHATKVLRDGAPELVAAVRAGDVPVSTASTLAELPREEQVALVAQLDPKVVASVVKERKREKRAKLDETRRARAAERSWQGELAMPSQTGVELRRCAARELLDSLDDGAVGLTMADPGWVYGATAVNGAAANHYDGMTVDEFRSDLNRAWDKAAANSYLLVWCTSPFLEEWFGTCALAALRGQPLTPLAGRAWRWEYVTALAWHKTGGRGIGTHALGDHEHLLVYRKGTPLPADPNNPPSSWTEAPPTVFTSPRRQGQHSEKPVEMLVPVLRTYGPPGCLVASLYAGSFPEGRAALITGHRMVGAELDEGRHGDGLDRLYPAKPLFGGGAR